MSLLSLLSCFFPQASLKPSDLSAFAHVCSDPRAQHYSQVIQRRAGACADRTRVRNHRYAALRALQQGWSQQQQHISSYLLQTCSFCGNSALSYFQEGKYFSEEQMRSREPLLYEQYIGQYLTDEEVRIPQLSSRVQLTFYFLG